jgi:hypothetical protein
MEPANASERPRHECRQPNDVTHHHERRRRDVFRRLRNVDQRRQHRALTRQATLRDNGSRGLRSASVCEQGGRNLGQAAEGHEEDERPGRLRQRLPVEMIGVASADDGDLRGDPAMREGDAGGGGHRAQRGNARYDVEWDARCP